MRSHSRSSTALLLNLSGVCHHSRLMMLSGFQFLPEDTGAAEMAATGAEAVEVSDAADFMTGAAPFRNEIIGM